MLPLSVAPRNSFSSLQMPNEEEYYQVKDDNSRLGKRALGHFLIRIKVAKSYILCRRNLRILELSETEPSNRRKKECLCSTDKVTYPINYKALITLNVKFLKKCAAEAIISFNIVCHVSSCNVSKRMTLHGGLSASVALSFPQYLVILLKRNVLV